MRWLKTLILRVLGLRPCRACFFWLAPWIEARFESYFFVKRLLGGEKEGLARGYEYLLENGVAGGSRTEEDRARVRSWCARYLAQGENLRLVVDETLERLERSELPAKQRFYGWVEDRSFQDEHALAHAERIFDGLRRSIEQHKGPLEGLTILELGPGHTLATGILAYVHGARSYVGADLFPIAGKATALYRHLRTHIERSFVLPVPQDMRAEALRRFDEVVKLDGPDVVLDESRVACRYPVDAAKLPFPDQSFDVVVSNAAFEHFTDPLSAVRECTRVLAPGGLGLHQIDFRDHRDPSKPLDFLRYEDDEWKKIHEDASFCYTNRLRKSDFERAFAASGVTLAEVAVNLKAPFDPAIRAQLHPRFHDAPNDDLEALSAFFVVKKPEAPTRALAS